MSETLKILAIYMVLENHSKPAHFLSSFKETIQAIYQITSAQCVYGNKPETILIFVFYS